MPTAVSSLDASRRPRFLATPACASAVPPIRFASGGRPSRPDGPGLAARTGCTGEGGHSHAGEIWWWNLRGDAVAHPTDSRWRVSWLAATSELYAVELTPAPHLSLRTVQGRAGRVREGSRPDRYILLGYFDDGTDVDAALAGWEQDDSLIYHNLSALAAQLPET